VFYKIEPEVAGGWGANTKFTRTVGRPTDVQYLHYQFDDWLGDDILESCMCFIVTDQLSQNLQKGKLTGFTMRDVEISKSEEFDFTFPKILLPSFRWLYVNGLAGIDDFGIGGDGKLVVSDRALNMLREMNLNHCEVDEFKDGES
jgi:hypothetical protein